MMKEIGDKESIRLCSHDHGNMQDKQGTRGSDELYNNDYFPRCLCIGENGS